MKTTATRMLLAFTLALTVLTSCVSRRHRHDPPPMHHDGDDHH